VLRSLGTASSVPGTSRDRPVLRRSSASALMRDHRRERAARARLSIHLLAARAGVAMRDIDGSGVLFGCRAGDPARHRSFSGRRRRGRRRRCRWRAGRGMRGRDLVDPVIATVRMPFAHPRLVAPVWCAGLRAQTAHSGAAMVPARISSTRRQPAQRARRFWQALHHGRLVTWEISQAVLRPQIEQIIRATRQPG